MRVAVTGASGLIGTALQRGRGRRSADPELVCVPVRRASGDARGAVDGPRWSVDGGFVPPDALSGFDGVVHLAGENVAGGRWTPRRRHAILHSRTAGTRAVVEALRHADPRPRVLVSASAVGYYGDTGARAVDESSPPGEDFLAEVCVAWEREAAAARELGVRLVLARIGVVLSRDGGALARLLPVFRAGLGGPVGDGAQYMSWIHVDDVASALRRLLQDEAASGPYNLVAPEPVTNRTLADTLADTLGRRAWLPVPRAALRLGLGEMSSVLLTGQRARPAALDALGYDFRFPRLDAALDDLVG